MFSAKANPLRGNKRFPSRGLRDRDVRDSYNSREFRFTGARRTYQSGTRGNQLGAPGPGAQRIPDVAAAQRPRPRDIPKTVHRGPANLPIWHTRKPGRRAGARRAGKSQTWQQQNAPNRASLPQDPFTGGRRTRPSGPHENQVGARGLEHLGDGLFCAHLGTGSFGLSWA